MSEMAGKESKVARVLIVAGSDSSGGAGIQADLKTVSALGTYGMTAITALTAQNTTGVLGIVETDPEFVTLQMKACLEDLGCNAIKTGMLANAGIVEAVAATASGLGLRGIPIVVDPVMVAKGGASLLDPTATDTLKRILLPLATVVTPNLDEAGVLTGRTLHDLKEMKEAARRIHDLGAQNVVVKGGHLEGHAIDVLFDGRDFFEYLAARIETKHSHGTGCIFASAIAAGLAKGNPVRESVAVAKKFVTSAIREGLPLGRGHGPANPMYAKRRVL